MTNEEAIIQLECLRDSAEMFEEFAENCEALQLAIETLKANRPKGRWKPIANLDGDPVMHQCTCCGSKWRDGWVFDFCPHCGASMQI